VCYLTVFLGEAARPCAVWCSAGTHVVLCLNKETKDRVYVKDGVADIFMLDNDNKEVSRREHINHMFMPTERPANPLWESTMLENWQRPYLRVDGREKVMNDLLL
jgi:hypothetical protein